MTVSSTKPALLLAAIPVVAAASAARGIDYRFDVATEANNATNTSYFTAAHLPALNFPSVNGHDIEQSNDDRQSAMTAAGNSLGMYYNSYNTLFSTHPSPADAVAAIHNYFTGSTRFGPGAPSRWLVLNEVDAGTWDGANGGAYRTWLVDTLQGLHNLGYEKIILWTPRYLASKTHASTWQAITQHAYLGLETYLDGYTIKNTHNYSLAKVQAYYQSYYDSWTSTTKGPGLPASKLFAGEHFGVYPHNYFAGQYFGSNGISGADWQAAIQVRSLAIRNIPFGGFIGYLWQRNELATNDNAVDLATQLSYERAYAATMVVQTEIPTWTGNGGSSTSWGDGFNWTGGLPSTTQHPYPLLAATNPTLPKQTTANFFNTIKAATTITLDGNRSVTRLAFDSPFVYTIAPGTGGSLTLTGSGASVAVNSGSHAISAGLVITSNVSANLTGNLSVSGPLTGNGVLLTKSGAGTLTISGAQSWSPGAQLIVNAGNVTLQSDAGAGGRNLVLDVRSPGRVSIESPQKLATLRVGAGAVTSVKSGGGNTLLVGNLTIDAGGAGGRLDLADNDLIVKTSTLAAVKALITAGYNNGAWNGGGGINSSAAAADPNADTAIGYADNAELGLSSFSGATLTGPEILVKYTYLGDADLTGVVDTDDFQLFLAGYQDSGLPRTWLYGDFDYTGVIDTDDFQVFLYGYQNQGGPLSALAEAVAGADGISSADRAFMQAAIAAVPEPGSLGVLGVAAAGSALRRRRAVSRGRVESG